MEIAIQHNDEKVILSDLGISANRRYLYFNLTDKSDSGELCL